MNKVRLESAQPRIGKILRLFRERTGRNQGEVSNSAGISTSMLSQIERGVVSPSIDTLMDVCCALGMDIAELFRRLSLKSPVRINHCGQRLTTGGDGAVYEQLIQSTDASHPAEMIFLEVEPGKQIGIKGQGHEGVEMGYVLKGSAEIVIDGTGYELSDGDSISFASYLPHKLINKDDGVFKAVWCVLPPHKDYLEQEV